MLHDSALYKFTIDIDIDIAGHSVKTATGGRQARLACHVNS